MAKFAEMDMARFDAWFAERPDCIKALVEKLPPDRLYRMKSTGHRVTIYSYSEDGTVTVEVTGQYNFLAFERRVFGIAAADLMECDLPSADERVGVMFP